MVRLLKQAALAGVSLLALAVPASADPIITSLVAAAAFLGSGTLAAGVANLAIGIATNVGLSLLQRALTKKPKPQGGVETSVDLGVEVYRKIAFGRCLVGGRALYVKGVGHSNKRYHYVWQLGDWTYEAIESIIYNGQPKTLTPVATVGPEDARYTVDGFNGRFVLKFFRGHFPATADPEVVAASADTLGQSIGAWTSAHRGDGCCLVTAYIDYDEKAFADGVDSQPQFVVKGARLYDFRKDSTAGGVGAHRWNDPTTWEYSENPALFDYNYERGFWRNGQLILGKGVGAADLLLSHYTTAANICDEALVEGGVPTKRYAGSHIATSEAEHRVAKESFRLAMAADFVEANGLTGPVAGAAYATVLAEAITDDDLIRGESFSYTRDPDEPYNAVACKWINPALNWQSDDLAMLTNPAWEAEDGGDRLIMPVDLQSVPYSYQAARIQKLVHEQSRMTAQCTGVYHRKYSRLEPGDWVPRTFNRKGYPAMTAKVIGVAKHKKGVQLTLRQCAPGNFTPPVGAPVTTPPPTVVPWQQQTLLIGFGVSSGFVEAAGQARPTLNVLWTAPTDPAIVAVQIEYRLLNNAASLRVERVSTPLAAGHVLAADILAAATYQVRIRPEFESGEVGTWTDWAEVETSTRFSVMSARVALDTEAYFKRMWSDYSVTPIAQALENLSRFMADADAETLQSRNLMSVTKSISDVNTTLSGQVLLVSASIDSLQQVVATNNEAFAADITEVSARLDTTQTDLEATSVIAQTAQAAADAASAAATASSAVAISAEAKANDATAAGLFKVEAIATSAGALASIGASVRVSTTGVAPNITYTTSGWFIDVFEESPGVLKGRMVVESNYFAVKTTGTPFIPFLVSGTDVYIQKVLVGQSIESDNFLEGVRGFKLDSTGTLYAENAIIGGGTSTKRPFEMAMGAFQGGVLTDEPTSSFDRTVTVSTYAPTAGGVPGGTTTIRVYGLVRRSPTFVQYDLKAVYNSVTYDLFRVVPKARNVPWAPVVLPVGQYQLVAAGGTANMTAAIEFTSAGTLLALSTKESNNGAAPDVRNAPLTMLDFLSTPDLDPLFTTVYPSTTVHVWKSVGIKGIRRIRVPDQVLVSSTPTPVVGMDVWMWGSAAARFGTAGGPGGFVKFRRAIQPGTMLSLLVGDSEDDGFLGFGYNERTNATPYKGGGAAFLWDGVDDRPRLIAVAAGGGAPGTGGNGGCGGSTSFGGGNGSSATDMTRCFGQSGAYSGEIPGHGGGSGYEGGGMNASPRFGRGGTSYADGLCTAVTFGVGGESGSGQWTSGVPGSSEAVYTANSTYPDMPNVATPNTVNGPGGAGMICIQWLTSL